MTATAVIETGHLTKDYGAGRRGLASGVAVIGFERRDLRG